MEIIQKVVVKQILTEASKQELIEYYTEQKRQIEQECDQLHFEQKKMERKSKFQPERVAITLPTNSTCAEKRKN
ncbi:Uncharacterized protein ylqD [Listeria monocytogenes]|nr:Uncharacterized protein ylqD [Listeria monocytogenes]